MMPPSPRFDAAVVHAATQRLEDFANENADVVLAVLTSSDGFEVAAYPVGRAMTARIAAMSSSMQALAEALGREAGQGKNRSVVIETDSGFLLVLGLAKTVPPMSLAVVAAGNELLGRLLWATRNLRKTLETSFPQ
jgi:predicted regulator of Ras-like GTPase activity (Roadblock/LC7/MglB family)